MKREQQIEKASIGRYPEWGEQQHALELAFQAGAMWADANPHWISVEDELPKEDGIYLFYDEASGVYTSAYYVGFAISGSITHWMPRPAPPEHLAGVSKMISSSELPNNQKGGKEC